MKLTCIRLLIATIIIFFELLVTAQDTLETQKNEKGKIIFGRFKPNESNKVKDGNTFLKKVLNTKPDNEFKLYKETTGELGITH